MTLPGDEVLIAKLRRRGGRVTSQRLMIHRALRARDQHVTAEQVLDAVSPALPRTSLPTVYATLELFEGLGLVRRVSTAGGAVLFDSRVAPHAHAVCRDCGAVTDVEETVARRRAFRRAREAGFEPDDAQLVIWGTCARCQARAGASPSGGQPPATRSRPQDSGETSTLGSSSNSYPQRVQSAS